MPGIKRTYSIIIGRYVYKTRIRRGYKAYTYYYFRTLLFLCCSPTNLLMFLHRTLHI